MTDAPETLPTLETVFDLSALQSISIDARTDAQTALLKSLGDEADAISAQVGNMLELNEKRFVSERPDAPFPYALAAMLSLLAMAITATQVQRPPEVAAAPDKAVVSAYIGVQVVIIRELCAHMTRLGRHRGIQATAEQSGWSVAEVTQLWDEVADMMDDWGAKE